MREGREIPSGTVKFSSPAGGHWNAILILVPFQSETLKSASELRRVRAYLRLALERIRFTVWRTASHRLTIWSNWEAMWPRPASVSSFAPRVRSIHFGGCHV